MGILADSMECYERRHDDRGGARLETCGTCHRRHRHARQGRVLRTHPRMPDERARFRNASRVLEADGYVPATEEQYLDHDVDLIVMNTCAVRENAAERMYGTIGLWAERKRQRPNLQIAVGGCMAQLDREKIAKKAPA